PVIPSLRLSRLRGAYLLHRSDAKDAEGEQISILSSRVRFFLSGPPLAADNIQTGMVGPRTIQARCAGEGMLTMKHAVGLLAASLLLAVTALAPPARADWHTFW